MNFYERLECLRKEKGVSQAEVVKTLGFGRNAFTQWKHGNMPNSSTQKVLADYFEVSVDYLMGREEVRNIPLGGQIMAYYPYEPQGMRPIVGITSAGNGIFAQESILGWEAVDAKYNNDNYFWLKVSGDSMTPKIDDGDLVLIQKDGQMENGCLGIILVDDTDAFLKQLYVDNESITLHSFNLYYPNRVFKKEEQNRLRFVGRAKEVRRTL